MLKKPSTTARAAPLANRARHPLGGGIKGHQIRIFGFEILELVQQPVEFLVGNLRVVVDVVALFVVTNRLAQLANAVGRLFHRSREST